MKRTLLVLFFTLFLIQPLAFSEEKEDTSITKEPDAIELTEEQIALDDEAFLFEDFDDLEDWEFEEGLGFEQFTEDELFLNENLASDQELGDFSDLEIEDTLPSKETIAQLSRN